MSDRDQERHERDRGRQLDALFQGTVADPNAPPATLTLDDLKRAYHTLLQPYTFTDPYNPYQGAGFAINAMDPYGASPFAPHPMPHGMPPTLSGESIMAECRKHGCLEIREEFDIALLQTVYTHIGPHHERTSISVSDRVRANAATAADELHAYLRQWLRSIHGEAPMPDTPDGPPFRFCALCGQERDPDVEPVELEVPGGPATWGPMPLRKADREGFYLIEACSRECATAYAIKLEPMRSQPRLGQFFEQRHAERDNMDARARVVRDIRSRGGPLVYVPADSESVHAAPHNPWTDDPHAEGS